MPSCMNVKALCQNAMFLRTFSRAGVNYFYKCSIHPTMTGEIQVR